MTGTTMTVSRLIKIPSSFNKLREESNDNDLILTEDNTPLRDKSQHQEDVVINSEAIKDE